MSTSMPSAVSTVACTSTVAAPVGMMTRWQRLP
jgi:hypothetical protein